MLSIPLTFVLAGAAFAVLWVDSLSGGTEKRRWWLRAFLILFIIQEIIIGLRFGYGIEQVKQIQPLTAALIPPLAYLSFTRPQLTPKVLIHLVPFVLVVAVLMVFYRAVDVILALNNLFYAVALARRGLAGPDGLSWVEIGRSKFAMILLWVLVVVLLVSGLTDLAISYDFQSTDGSNTGKIASWATLVGTVTVVACVLLYRRFGVTGTQGDTQSDKDQNAKVFDKLQAFLKDDPLYLDPDINLNRIARRMKLPARDVSKAINGQTGLNVSQFINEARVGEACRLLQDTDLSITQIIYASGFNTKSNFNREFTRVTASTPSEWRSRNKG
jgi:AraC-like DNA-binding protein